LTGETLTGRQLKTMLAIFELSNAFGHLAYSLALPQNNQMPKNALSIMNGLYHVLDKGLVHLVVPSISHMNELQNN
jgi:hypothetical protein